MRKLAAAPKPYHQVAPVGIKVALFEPGGMKTDWAGSSMTIPPMNEPYRQTVGAFAKMIPDYSGSNRKYPAEVAQVVLKLAGQGDAPGRLLLGTNSVQYAPAAAKTLAESDAKWHDLSVAVALEVVLGAQYDPKERCKRVCPPPTEVPPPRKRVQRNSFLRQCSPL